MSHAVRSRRLESLRVLAQRPKAQIDTGLLADCLECLLEGTAARWAVAFTGAPRPRWTLDRKLSSEGSATPALKRALAAFAERSLATRRAVLSQNLREDRDGVDDATEILARGANAILAVPVFNGSEPFAVLVLAFRDAAELDDEAQAFAELAAGVAALRAEAELSSPPPSQEAREETSRMVSLGLLTATVAHELRGPAGALLLQQEELRRLVEQIEPLAGGADSALGGVVGELLELSTDIGAAVARIRDTVDQLSTVSRREIAPEHVDLAVVVSESLAVARPLLERRGVTLHTQFEANCFTIARRDNLSQVVLNLTFNAIDATKSVSQPQVWVRVVEAGEQVALVVDDNGPGVPPAAVNDIFKPFFTTKQRGSGTGLGLKICSDVVTAHGGHIEVDEREGGGASFRVLLPRTHQDSAVMAIGSAEQTRSSLTAVRKRSVLVVDDDPVFSRTVRRALKPHEVRTVSAASEAEVLLLAPDYRPDLILCDVFLPGANGDVLHARVSRHRPELARRFVFVTGGALGKQEADYLRRAGLTTLFKPVELRTLLELFEENRFESTRPNSVRTLGQLPPSSNLTRAK